MYYKDHSAEWWKQCGGWRLAVGWFVYLVLAIAFSVKPLYDIGVIVIFFMATMIPAAATGMALRDFANARKAASGAVKCTGIQKAGSLSLFFALVFVDYALGIFVCYRIAAENHAVQTATMSVCAGLAAACLIASTICLIIMHKRRKASRVAASKF